MQMNYKRNGKLISKKGCGVGCLTWIVMFIIIVVIIGSSKDSKKSTTDTQTSTDVSIISTVAETTQSIPSEHHVYDDAEVRDLMNGSNTEKIGEYSILRMNESDVTDDFLNDWFFNYVQKNDFNYCLIIYNGANETGVYSSSGYVVRNAGIKLTSGDYSYYTGENEIMYFPNDDGTALEIYDHFDTSDNDYSSQSEETAEPSTTQEIMVWISDTGSKYHNRSSCSGMNNPRQISLEDAESMGYSPCKRCY